MSTHPALPRSFPLGSSDRLPPVRTSDAALPMLVKAIVAGAALCVPFLAMGFGLIYSEWSAKEKVRLAEIEAAQAYERLIAAPAGPKVDLAAATHGRDLFATVCVACHGPNGTGMPGLGKNLVESDFVAGQNDDAMAQFLVRGRMDAKPLPMPPKGGRADLTDADMQAVVAYLRGLQDPRRLPELPPMTALVLQPTEADKAAALAAAGGDAELAGYIAHGTTVFNTTCIACHGPGGVGVKGNGKTLVANDFIKGLNDDNLLAFIKRGRDPSDPKNSTGVQMPPKGGNPALSDDDLLDVISYLRTLQGTPPAITNTAK